MRMTDFSWLPAPMSFSAFSGDKLWYTEQLYEKFLQDLVTAPLVFKALPVLVSKQKEADGRLKQFWHVITDPHSHDMSDIKLLRAEKIVWIKPCIEHASDENVLVYEREKWGEVRTHILIPDREFIVILTKKKDVYYFVTAYHIDYTYTLKAYIKEYERYGSKTKTAP
jgi:hypothetical protein